MIDRTQEPAFRDIDKVELMQASTTKLSNGIPVYFVNAGSQELVRIEWIFNGGVWQQSRPLQASMANTMLNEGTKKYTAAQLADGIDYYGAFLENDISQDNSSVSLYTLNKHADKALAYVEDLIKNSVFPQNEFETIIQNKKQKFLVSQQKVDHVARKKFSELLFGGQHPYGKQVNESDFDTIKREDAFDFYKKHYSSNGCKIVISGRVDDKLISILDKYFGGNDWSNNKFEVSSLKFEVLSNKGKHLVEKIDALQSAIRIGKLMVNKTHKDYHSLQVLNTLLGGYFGSRLMANIREDKGYTYGVGSGVVSFINAGYFFVSTEVGVDVCAKAVDEIYFEINRLKQELVSEEELALVKNYMMGTFLRSADGPFALADKFKGIMYYGLGYDYYDKYVSTIKTINPEDIMKLANQYFDVDNMIELVVGKK